MGILNILIIKYDKNHTNAFERKDLVTQETRKNYHRITCKSICICGASRCPIHPEQHFSMRRAVGEALSIFKESIMG